MYYLRQSFILLLCCLVSSAFAWYTSTNAQYKQPDDRQVDAWIKALSTKKDPHGSKLKEISLEISEMDSSTWCQTIDRINSSAQHANIPLPDPR